MANHKARITQSDVSRAVKGALAGGLAISQVVVSPDGTLTITTGNPDTLPNDVNKNEWDEVFHAATK